MIDALTMTVPISLFNRGCAGKIFEDVRKNGTKVVIKNNRPEGVIMAPDTYLRIQEKLEELDDMHLAAIAEERLAHMDSTKLISHDEMMRQLGLTDEDLEGFEDVELE